MAAGGTGEFYSCTYEYSHIGSEASSGWFSVGEVIKSSPESFHSKVWNIVWTFVVEDLFK